MTGGALRVVDYGDAALLVTVTAGTHEQRWARAQNLADALRRAQHRGLTDAVGTYADVLVILDPLVTTPEAVRSLIKEHSGVSDTVEPGKQIIVPVVYGGSFGPDLEAVAEELGITPDELIDLHSGTDWTVRFCASPAGAPFLEGPRLPKPVVRCAQPRVQVPAGSIGLSGQQSMIYPSASPGGWRLIGRTQTPMFASAEPFQVLHSPGDTMRFVPISEDEWQR